MRGEVMIIKRGTIVSHAVATDWGAGKILEVSALRATIQFSDGVTRKIASSHFSTLKSADAASYVPAIDSIPVEKKRPAQRKPRQIKQPKV
jgi:hypothetical protein